MKKNTVLLEKLRNSYYNSFIDSEIALTRIINQEDIGRLFALLRQLLFPECLGVDYSINSKDFENQIEKVEEKLMFLIKNIYDKNESVAVQDLVERIMASIPDLRNILLKDLKAAYDGDPAANSFQEIILVYPGFEAIMVYRLAHLLWREKVPILPRMMTEYAHSKTGIDIHPGADIGEYFFIDHGTGVVIGETSKIGDHVKLYQGVTLGALSTNSGQKLRKKKRHPTIEDCVTIYAGATILGGETVIGERTVVGSNAFITRSIPIGTKVCIQKPELLFKNVASESTRMGDIQCGT
mgnify:CR=1 FL=1